MPVIELSQKLTSLSDLGTVTTIKAAVATTFAVPKVIELKTSVLILPKDISNQKK